MKKNRSPRKKRTAPKAILRLPDLGHAKAAVLNSLACPDAQRGYRHAIDEFIDWYCSEPRLAFNKTVVLRYRLHLEFRKLAPGTINLRLGAVRRLAYEAADCGLLSLDLAAVSGRRGFTTAWYKSHTPGIAAAAPVGLRRLRFMPTRTALIQVSLSIS